jgi:hypothetical protein
VVIVIDTRVSPSSITILHRFVAEWKVNKVFLNIYVSKGFLGRVLVENTFLVLENFQKW